MWGNLCTPHREKKINRTCRYFIANTVLTILVMLLWA